MLWGVHLFRDDLEQLCDIVGQPVAFVVDDMRYDSIDELRDHRGDTISKLNLASYNEHSDISIRFSFGVQLVASGRHTEFLQAKEVLSTKVHWAAQNPALSAVLGFVASVGTGMVFAILLMRLGIPLTYWFSPVSSAMIFVAAWLFFKYGIAESRIHLVRRHQYQQASLWARNKDKIIYDVGKYVIGAIVGAITLWLISTLAEKSKPTADPQEPPAATAEDVSESK